MSKDLESKILDKLEQALLASRQSTPDSLSPILFEIRNKIDEQGRKLDDHILTHESDTKGIKEDMVSLKNSVSPAVSVVNAVGGMQKGMVWLATLIVAVITIVGPFLAYKEWLKK